jgi:CcmD family protein
MPRFVIVIRRAALVALAWLWAAPLGAQEAMNNLQPTAFGAQSLRPYWHVFIAYSIAILLILGWVLTISRRLRDVEQRLSD